MWSTALRCSSERAISQVSARCRGNCHCWPGAHVNYPTEAVGSRLSPLSPKIKENMERRQWKRTRNCDSELWLFTEPAQYPEESQPNLHFPALHPMPTFFCQQMVWVWIEYVLSKTRSWRLFVEHRHNLCHPPFTLHHSFGRHKLHTNEVQSKPQSIEEKLLSLSGSTCHLTPMQRGCRCIK